MVLDMEETTEAVEKKKGRRTDAEIKAEGKAEMAGELDALKKQMADLAKATNAKVATVTAAQANKIPALRRNKVVINNDVVRGLAHATGGASHPDNEDGSPWTPGCPDWVYESFGGTDMEIDEDGNGQTVAATEEGELAEYLFKQAYLDNQKIVDIDMLVEVMANYNAGKPTVTQAPEFDAKELAAVAVV